MTKEIMNDAEIEAARAAARERGMNCIMAQDDADELVADVAELAILRRRAAIAADVIDGLNQTALRLTTGRDEAMRLAADIDKDRGRLAERTKELDEKLAAIAVLVELISDCARGLSRHATGGRKNDNRPDPRQT